MSFFVCDAIHRAESVGILFITLARKQKLNAPGWKILLDFFFSYSLIYIL